MGLFYRLISKVEVFNVAFRFLISLLFVLSLAGCSATSAIGNYVSPSSATLVAAPSPTQDDAPTRFYKYYRTSLKYCQNYEQQVVDANNSFNAGSDIGTLIYTTLASVFTPITTVHALTAAAAITTGIKTSIDTNVTADDTVNISIALDKIYFIPMAQLSQQAFATPVTDANISGFEADVDNYQIQCSISHARVYIRQNLSSAPAVNAQGSIVSETKTTASPNPDSTIGAAPAPGPTPPIGASPPN